MSDGVMSVGYVYFIEAKRCRLIKIGYSDDPQARMRNLQMAGPDALTLLAVMPGGIDVERSLHAKFAKTRVHGEWFKPTQRLRTFITKVLATHDQDYEPIVRDAPPAKPVAAKPPKPRSPISKYPSLSGRVGKVTGRAYP